MSQKENWNNECPLYGFGEISKECFRSICSENYQECIFYTKISGVQNNKGLEKEVAEEIVN